MILVSQNNNRVTGFVSAIPLSLADQVASLPEKLKEDFSPELTLYHLAQGVDPKAQGQGLGRLLLEQLIEQALQLGYITILTRTHGDNQNMIHLFESLRFVRISEYDHDDRIYFLKELK